MAKAAAAAPKMTFGELKGTKLKAIDALFFLAFGLVAIGMAVGFTLR